MSCDLRLWIHIRRQLFTNLLMKPNTSAAGTAVPEIDRCVPENLQTATFAFG